MSIFDMFKPKSKLSRADQQWNKMWERWAKGNAPSPYDELMRYQSEVYNGGHGQYFCNTDNCFDLEAEVKALLTILPPELARKIQQCYTAYKITGNDSNDEIKELYQACDDAFDENEERINGILESYAATIRL